MPEDLIVADHLSPYEVHEVAVIIVAALAFVIAVGGVAIATILICGWRGAQTVSIDWAHGKASFACRR